MKWMQQFQVIELCVRLIMACMALRWTVDDDPYISELKYQYTKSAIITTSEEPRHDFTEHRLEAPAKGCE